VKREASFDIRFTIYDSRTTNMDNVLILYNQFEQDDTTFMESHAGVMDQVKAVSDSLDKLGIMYEVLPVENLRHLAGILSSRPEKLVFNLIEEFAGSIKDACVVPAMCEAFGVSCTGNGTEALFLAQDKTRAKAILTSAGLPCPQGVSVKPGQKLPVNYLEEGKYIIKPACCDASEGIEVDSVVDIPSKQADARIKWIHEKFNQPAIVEKFIPARELNVSVVEIQMEMSEGRRKRDEGRIIHHPSSIIPRVLPLAEIDFSAFSDKQFKLVDYQAKWVKDSFGYNNTPRIIPAQLAEPVAEKVRHLALQAWDALGCRGYARVDFRLDEKDNPYVLEVNPNPDISPDAGFAAALEAAKIPYEQFVSNQLETCIRK
jgi:D-alanine-D-alanine ligase